MIWEYKDSDLDNDYFKNKIKKTDKNIFASYAFSKCEYCKTEINELTSLREYSSTDPSKLNKTETPSGYLVYDGNGLGDIYQENWNRNSSDIKITVYACNTCGWWNVLRTETSTIGVNPHDIEIEEKIYVAWATLKKLDVSNIKTPSEELKKYLLAKFDDRFLIRPKVFEDIVGGIFKDFGYYVRVIGQSGDGGIDVIILDGEKNDLTGVQVKRYKGKIGVEQIRAFEGALLFKGLPKGIFVTTSSFTQGAVQTASDSKTIQNSIPIELVDAKKLYDYLQLTKRKEYEYKNDSSAPFYRFLENPKAIPFIYSAFSIF